MNDILKKTINYYCHHERNDFKKSGFFKSIEKLSKNNNLKVKCDIVSGEYNKPDSNNLYLSIEILDRNNKPVEIYDEGSLGYATILVMVDKKDRIKFYSWDDDDFIDSLKWITHQLSKIVTIE